MPAHSTGFSPESTPLIAGARRIHRCIERKVLAWKVMPTISLLRFDELEIRRIMPVTSPTIGGEGPDAQRGIASRIKAASAA